MRYKTINDINHALRKHVSIVAVSAGDNQSLNRMWPILELLGNPQEKLRVIHVSGTSGKTSTCYYITALLHRSGMKIGTTVSPHVDSITERVQVNGRPLSDDVFCKYFSLFYKIVESSVQNLSFFELFVLFELWVFKQEEVDYAVIETGMGGLLDATNVARRKDKVAVITTIGFDHMHILGTTLGEITHQKAGIVHTGNHVFHNEQAQSITDVIQKRIKDKNAFSHIAELKSSSKLQLLPEFQRVNWLLAYKVAQFIADRDSFKLIIIDPTDVFIPARMEEIILQDNSLLIMDGAHNEQKTLAFVKSFQERFPRKKATILVALKKGKEYGAVLSRLAPIADFFIFTTFKTTQDLPAISQDPLILQRYAIDGLGIESVIITDLNHAYEKLLHSGAAIKIATGSFYLLGQLRDL